MLVRGTSVPRCRFQANVHVQLFEVLFSENCQQVHVPRVRFSL